MTQQYATCPVCKKQIIPGSKFCQSCGSKIEEIKPTLSFIQCPACGTQLPTSAKFCQKCGCNIAQYQVPQPQNVCQQCGKPLKETDNFCLYCGTKVIKSVVQANSSRQEKPKIKEPLPKKQSQKKNQPQKQTVPSQQVQATVNATAQKILRIAASQVAGEMEIGSLDTIINVVKNLPRG